LEYDGDVGLDRPDFAMLCSFVKLDRAIPLLLGMDKKACQMLEKTQEKTIYEMSGFKASLTEKFSN
jgi:hypothetical protein